MDCTVSVFPSSRELKEKLRFPLGMAYYPTNDSEETEYLTGDSHDLVTCRNCKAYLSPECPVEEDHWKCIFCNSKNQYENTEAFHSQSNKPSFNVILGKKTDISQIFVVYLSTEFEEIDFMRAKVFTYGLLRNLPEDARCVIMIGSDEPGFALLEPTSDNSVTVIKGKTIRMLIGSDLSKYFFTKANAHLAERIIDRIQPSRDTNPHKKAIDYAQLLSSYVQNLMPIRFIAVIQSITRKAVDMELLRQCLVRLDFIVVESSPKTASVASDLPGSVEFLSNRNPALQAKHLVEQETRYQMVLRYNTSKCQIDILRTPRPFADSSDQTLFMPVVPYKDYPLAVEVSPAAGASRITIQFATKYILVKGNERHFMLNVTNRVFATTTDLSEYTKSVNWNCAIWFWMRKVANKTRPEVISALFKVVASIMKALEDKVPEDVIKAICAIPKADMFSEHEERAMRAFDMLYYGSPKTLCMIPKLHETAQKRIICQSLNGITEERNEKEEGPSKEAIELQMKLPVYVPVGGTIQQEFLGINHTAMTILQNTIDKL